MATCETCYWWEAWPHPLNAKTYGFCLIYRQDRKKNEGCDRHFHQPKENSDASSD